jgi:hypothetical protein
VNTKNLIPGTEDIHKEWPPVLELAHTGSLRNHARLFTDCSGNPLNGRLKRYHHGGIDGGCYAQ